MTFFLDENVIIHVTMYNQEYTKYTLFNITFLDDMGSQNITVGF